MAKDKAEKVAEEQPKPKKAPVDDTPQGKTIDERMDDLLKDHKRMGAR
jgi:hypothetical protein